MKQPLLLLVLLISLSGFSQPTGVYVSAGPTTSFNSSIKASNAAYSFVDGVLVRLNWKDLEPTDDNFDWTLIENQIDSANYYGIKISLGVGAGDNLPDWLIPQVATYTFDFQGNTSTRVPSWDATFLSEWTEFVTALGNEFGGNSTIDLVYITNSSANGFEMQLPFGTVTPDWNTLGYSEENFINSWKTVVDAFDSAFPNTYLSNDFHPVLGSNAPADSIYEYASSTIGSRYGASAWWWSQHNTTVYPSQYELLQTSVSNSFGTVQVARSGTQDSAQLGAGGLYGALDLAKTQGICYWEIWEQDIVNPDFHPLLDTIACSAITSIDDSEIENDLLIFPNPASNYLNVETGVRTQSVLNVFNSLGNCVLSRSITNSSTVNLDVSRLSKGVYLMRVSSDDKSYTGRFVKE